MGGDDSQKLLPWRGIPSSPGRKPPAQLRINNVTETAGWNLARGTPSFWPRPQLQTAWVTFGKQRRVNSAARRSDALIPLINAYPVGQTPLDATTDQINLVASNTVREDSGMIRFDYRFNDQNTLYARYNIDDVYIDNPTDALGSHNVVPHVPSNGVLAFQHLFTPSTINEAKFGVNRANYHNWSYGIAPVATSVSSASFSGLDRKSVV